MDIFFNHVFHQSQLVQSSHLLIILNANGLIIHSFTDIILDHYIFHKLKLKRSFYKLINFVRVQLYLFDIFYVYNNYILFSRSKYRKPEKK